MLAVVSPTVFREGRYRFFFFSREEERMHVHVSSPDGEAKFWVTPTVSLATYEGIAPRELARLQRIVEEHGNEIREAWKTHFNR